MTGPFPSNPLGVAVGKLVVWFSLWGQQEHVSGCEWGKEGTQDRRLRQPCPNTSMECDQQCGSVQPRVNAEVT